MPPVILASCLALAALLVALSASSPAHAQEVPVAETSAPASGDPPGMRAEPVVPVGPLGVVALVDDRALLDRVEVRVGGLTLPPEGSVYRAWLRSDDDTLTQLVGDLAFDHLGAGASIPAPKPTSAASSSAGPTAATAPPPSRASASPAPPLAILPHPGRRHQRPPLQRRNGGTVALVGQDCSTGP